MSVKIRLSEKVGYGLGDMASSMFWKLFGTYLLFFYTDVFGITAAAAGTMFLVTRFWDTLLDPVVGLAADRTQTKWGKFRPYLLYTAVPFGIIGVLTFTVPNFSDSNKLIYAYITYTLMMVIYSIINVPYASLLGVITPDLKDRNILASYRMSFAFLGSLLALAIIETLVSYFTKKGNTINCSWQYSVCVIAVMCVVLFIGCFLLVKERVSASEAQGSTFRQDITDLLKNKPWWILLGAGIFALIFNSIRDGAAIYYFKYFIQKSQTFEFLKISFTLSTLYLVVGQAANIVGVISASVISNKIGKKKTYTAAMFCSTVLSILFFWIGKEYLALIFILQFAISFCAGIIFPLLWSMYADIADYSSLKTGRRATGLIFSSSSMSQKLGWAIGGALTGWLLGLYGFKANAVQSGHAQLGIRLMLSFIPAVGSFFSFIFILMYPLNEKILAANKK